MREYYKQLAHEHGGKIRSKWIDAYALVDDTYEYCRDFQDIDKQSGFYLTDEVHEKFDPFQPLDSISKNIERNVFFYDYVEYKKNEILIKEDRDQSKYALFVDEVVSEIAQQLNLKKH